MAEVVLERVNWEDEPSEDTPIDSGNLKKMEDNLETFVKKYWKQEKIKEREILFPIGFKYVTQLPDQNPADILGIGTWERFDGKLAVGIKEGGDSAFNKIGQTVGEEKHKLNVEEVPGGYWHTNGRAGDNLNTGFKGDSTGYGMNAGASAVEHNNIQPTEVVGYMWIRRK